MMRFHWPISNLTFFRSAENEYNQFSWVIFGHSVIQENWKIELAEPCTDQSAFYLWSAVCSLQSAFYPRSTVCSLRFTLTGLRKEMKQYRTMQPWGRSEAGGMRALEKNWNVRKIDSEDHSKFSAPTIAFLAFWLAKKLRLWADSRSFTSHGK